MKNLVMFAFTIILSFQFNCQAHSDAYNAKNATADSKDSTYLIQLSNRQFLPDPGLEPALQQLLDAGQTTWGILQTWQLPQPADRSRFSDSGIKLLQFMGGTVYLAQFTQPIDLEKEKELIRWAGLLQPEDKQGIAIYQNKLEKWAITEDGRWKIAVRFFDGVPEPETKALFKKYQLAARQNEGSGVWYIQISPEQLKELLRENTIQWVEPGPSPFRTLEEKE